ncbi:MAG: tRNA (adenosine(37)-N6)-threonylcarbamoyltransferase complex transferase subunit TsaD [Candidatus Daviesbacteria bacterium]|nr:tRNA (adenosine(37)-N6)-threonylcarbamoyltransferase complex transferase subunit TsaD [Candidatus Daviesbacteria bacterium]
MIILGIETSCDETAAAVLTNNDKQSLRSDLKRIKILSNVVASSASLQAKYGGIIPEQAAREQIKSIIPVIQEGLRVAGYSGQEIDAIAVTYGPGLIGSLLVGVETTKVLATIWNKPLIPVNHLLGHFYANWISQSSAISYQLSDRRQKKSDDRRLTPDDLPKFPCLGLLVSGGHTDLVLFTDHGKYKYLGGTRDDAAGECFDKCARLLGLPYPGGPEISKLASQGQALRFKLPVPMKESKDLDFSYSGLKTAVARIVNSGQVIGDSKKADLAAAIEETIVQSLIAKVLLALKKYPVKDIMIAGGVAANQKLKLELGTRCKELGIKLHIPPPQLCTDNAAMIASAAFFINKKIDPLVLQANPNLSL